MYKNEKCVVNLFRKSGKKKVIVKLQQLAVKNSDGREKFQKFLGNWGLSLQMQRSSIKVWFKYPLEMLYSTKSLILFSDVVVLWMFLKTFITENTGYALILMAVIIGSIEFYRIPPLPDEKISDNILKLFEFDNKNAKKNVIFHKGGAGHAPENTIEAVQKAASLGVSSVEIDLDFTSDGYGVVIHGPLVDDTTEGTGSVQSFTLSEIQALNAAHKDQNKATYPVVRVPTLEAVIQECLRLDLVVFIDCKSDAKKTAALVAGLFRRHPQLYSSAVVCSFYPNIIYAVRSLDPHIVTACTHRPHILTSLGDGSERNTQLWRRGGGAGAGRAAGLGPLGRHLAPHRPQHLPVQQGRR